MYHGVRVSGVTVTQGEMVEVSVGLPRIDENRDVSVQELEIPYRADTTTAAAQDQLRQASSGIGEGLGAKQMSQTGASDAGSAAARVVGVTIESSQLVIRGLGGRYTRGAAEWDPRAQRPTRRAGRRPGSVPHQHHRQPHHLEVVPARHPRRFRWRGDGDPERQLPPAVHAWRWGRPPASNTQSTFRDRLDYTGGSKDKRGIDDGRRSLSPLVPTDTRVRNQPDEQRYAIARSLRPIWQYQHQVGVAQAGRWTPRSGTRASSASGNRFGYLVTAGYEYDSVRRVGVSRPNPQIVSETELVESSRFDAEIGADEVQMAALATASLDLGIDHSMTVLTLFNRSVSDETALQNGKTSDYARLEKWQLQFLARTLWFNQAFGDHRNLGGTRLRLALGAVSRLRRTRRARPAHGGLRHQR
jgi:hypothetical protein